MDKLNQLTENQLYDLIVESEKLTDIRRFVTIAQEFDKNIYTQDWKTFTDEFRAAKNRDQKNKLEESKKSLAKKIAKLIFDNIELEQEEEYHSPTAEEAQQEADKLKKKLGLPAKKAKAVSPKKAASVYKGLLKLYSHDQKEEAEKSILKKLKEKSPKELLKYLNALQKHKKFDLLEKLDENTDEEILLNASIYHHLKDYKNIKPKSKSKSPKSKSPKSKSPVRPKSPKPKSPKPKSPVRSIYKCLVDKGYTSDQKEEAKKYILKKLKEKSPKELLKYLTALQKQKGVVLLEELDESNEEILLNASIYHTLKDIKNNETQVRLNYLKQLCKGKECDTKKLHCDENELCDLESKRCLDETKEEYYENMDRRFVKGKYYGGTKETLDRAFPPEESEEDEAAKKAAKKAAKEAKKAAEDEKKQEPEEEEVDLDLDVKDLGKLSELQRALVECLMPAGK